MKVEEILKEQRNYLVGQGRIQEADETYNNFNREIIEAYANENGKCYLGNINFYDDTERKKIAKGELSCYQEYIGQQIYNFAYSFIVPVEDRYLKSLIQSWNSGLPNQVTVNQIFNRIEALGGLVFSWS